VTPTSALLLLDDAVRSPELRHEIGEPVGDPLAFVELGGRRVVVGPQPEEVVLGGREDLEFWPSTDLGAIDLVQDRSVPDALIWPELARRALERLGVSRVVVPGSFPVVAADHLREHGVEVSVDPERWTDRRRRKAAWELEGQERAQRAADAAFARAAAILREAEPAGDGTLRLDGETLTCERVREEMSAELLARGAESEEILVQAGDAALDGHDLGTGPVLADVSLVIDCFPRDRRSGAHTDMTRTFAPGTASAELRRLHADCRRTLELVLGAVRPGVEDLHRRACEHLAARGHPTQLTDDGPEPLREGFYHGLGHGVGLEVHEKPGVGRRSDPLVEGDVVALEPGLYYRGVGGVRLEDTVRVTADGWARLGAGEPFPYDLTP
jgi:Xaa-Pro aminopeptidase